MLKIFYSLIILLYLISCSSNEEMVTSNPTDIPQNTPSDTIQNSTTISALSFIDEFIIPDQTIEGTAFGGISGIDYANATWYLISDASKAPIRYYTADIVYDDNAFSTVQINTMVTIKDTQGDPLGNGLVDPEGIRFDMTKNRLIYTSEGSVNTGIAPSLYEISIDGTQQQNRALPDYFNPPTPTNTAFGARHNGTLEGLSLSYDTTGYWVGMELPLLQDGPEPTTTDTESPVRITLLNTNTGEATRQFVYELDPIARPIVLGSITINGLVEILEYDTDQFLVLERSFSSGYLDGGSTLKLYKVDASAATNTVNMNTLNANTHTKATKTLLINFDTLRTKLTNGVVGNVEGMTFGPKLDDGSKTLVVVSDNNFNAVVPQLSQLIAFKITP